MIRRHQARGTLCKPIRTAETTATLEYALRVVQRRETLAVYAESLQGADPGNLPSMTSAPSGEAVGLVGMKDEDLDWWLWIDSC